MVLVFPYSLHFILHYLTWVNNCSLHFSHLSFNNQVIFWICGNNWFFADSTTIKPHAHQLYNLLSESARRLKQIWICVSSECFAALKPVSDCPLPRPGTQLPGYHQFTSLLRNWQKLNCHNQCHAHLYPLLTTSCAGRHYNQLRSSSSSEYEKSVYLSI